MNGNIKTIHNYIFFSVFFFFIVIDHTYASDVSFMNNVDSHQITSLDGTWRIIIDPYENGYYDYRYTENKNGYFRNVTPRNKSHLVEYNFDTNWILEIPGDWNTRRDELLFYEGTIWYKRSFDYDLKPSSGLFVYFEAVNDAVELFESVKVSGIRLRLGNDERVTIEDPNAFVLWARFYEIETNRLIFYGCNGIKRYDF